MGGVRSYGEIKSIKLVYRSNCAFVQVGTVLLTVLCRGARSAMPLVPICTD